MKAFSLLEMASGRQSRVQIIGWYLFWFAIVLFLFAPGMEMFPKKDHFFFMLGRHLFENDLVWFMKTLSYNRTRILFPGDYFAFRPVLMAILGLEDIFLRHHLLVLGIIGCSLFSFTATAFFLLIRKITGFLPALFLTLIWVANLAGSEILLWQHITPYVLAPGFLCTSFMLLFAENVSRRNVVIAGLFAFGACLSHEVGVMVCSMFAILSFFALRKRPDDRFRISSAFLLPSLLALALNGIDYLILNPPPSLLGPIDFYQKTATDTLLERILTFLGAIGTALVAPQGVKLSVQNDWAHLWRFTTINSWLLLASGLLVVLITTGSGILGYRFICRCNRTPDKAAALASIFLIFFLATFSICSFRIVARGIDYLFSATYYFSFIVISLCGMLSAIFTLFQKRWCKLAVTAVFGFLAAFHVVALRSFLDTTAENRTWTASVLNNIRKVIDQNPQTCFAGFDPFSITEKIDCWTPLFQDISCPERPKSTPLYLVNQKSGPVLAVLESSSQPLFYKDIIAASAYSPYVIPQFSCELPYGTPFNFTLVNTSAFVLVLTDQSGMTQGIRVNHNLVSTIGREYRFISLPFNPAHKNVSYRVDFTPQEIIFMADNRLVSVALREKSMERALVGVQIITLQESDNINLVSFKAAIEPVSIELRILPAYNLFATM